MKRTVILVVLAACGSDGNTGGIPDACNPLGGEGCLMPWPSMAYAKTDTTSATGFRLDLPIEGMPVNGDGIAVDPKPLINRWDGFSPTGPILVQFPAGVSGDNLPPFSDPAQSLAADSPIVLLNMDTGEREPFFAEIDQNVPDVPERDLIIRPLVRLPEKTRIAVAIRNTVKAADGTDLPVSAGFKAIRDGGGFTHPRFGGLQARSADVFTALATAGVDKSELVLAWDYVTASDAFLQNDLTVMRTAALPAIGDKGANLSFVATLQPANTTSYALYLGTFKSPTFLSDGEADDSQIVRDATGNPMLGSMRDANFAAVIPACVSDPNTVLPRPTVIFGHGLFGSAADYLNDPFVQDLADQLCVNIFAGDWIGLTDRQIPLAPLAINDMNRGPQITEKLGQAVIDFIALEMTRCAGRCRRRPQFSYMRQAGGRHVEDLLHRRIARRDPGQHADGVRPEPAARRARGTGRRLVAAVRAQQRVVGPADGRRAGQLHSIQSYYQLQPSRSSAWRWSPTIRSPRPRTCSRTRCSGNPTKNDPDVVLRWATAS